MWTFDSTRKQFYFHQFSSGQPDLNYRSLKVRQEIKEILKFWVELGIDGLFLADILYLMEPKFENAKKQMSQPGNILPETYQLIEDWIDQVSKLSNNRIFTVTNEIMTGYQQSLENIGIDLVLNSTACSLTPVNDPDGFNLLNCTTKYVD